MNIRLVTKCVTAVAVCFLLAATASAQWSSPTQIGVVEGVDQMQGLPPSVSSARCGNNVVVGFSDTESNVNNSMDGYAVSSDGGKTFRDLGVLPANTADPGFGPDRLTGQVSLACGGSQLFYYASSFLGDQDAPFCDPLCTAISVSISRDGGGTWALPVVAASNFGDTHEISAPSIAVDPTSLPRIYVAYIDENFVPPTDVDFLFPECESFDVMELRLARSVDGGKTWTIGVIDHACATSTETERQGTLESPRVTISPGGKVYIAYEFHAGNGDAPAGKNEIRFTRSVNQGQTFSAPFVVSNDAIDNARPQLAVDRTTSSFRGAIYLTWSGMPGGTTTEVLMSDSLNQGVSFTFPRVVRGTSAGTQIDPVVAVDNDGQVATCYYVTGTNTPTSSSTYFYNCLTSVNHTATWAEYQKLVTSAPPGFDAITSDFLLLNDGFFTAFELPDSSTTRKLVGSTSDNP